MKKTENHGPYCGCIKCKPRGQPIDQSLVETGIWPALKPEEKSKEETRPKSHDRSGCA